MATWVEGITDVLLGCEVAAEMGQVKVYGLVTNYWSWVFLRSFDEKIEEDKCDFFTMRLG